MGKHLIFYDETCGLCDHVVQFILLRDQKGLFNFASLSGMTASKFINKIDEDTFVLIENYQTDSPQLHMLGGGAFRTLWLLGGFWSLIGILTFLPSFCLNWAYRLVAKNRRLFFPRKECSLPKNQFHDRFLP